jgi:AraC-like DNA-binding protein
MNDAGRSELARINSRLKEKMLRWLPEPELLSTAVDGLRLSRRDEPDRIENCFSEPGVGVIVQGFKRSVIGSQEFCYGANQCMVAGVDMPSSFAVVGASPEEPFLAVALVLDKVLITRLAAETPLAPGPGKGSCKGISVVDVDPGVLDAFLRLVELLDKPGQIPVLAPMIVREIHYRLLVGPQGGHLRRLNTLGTQSNQIAQAINWLRQNYREPLQVDELARRVHMATSTFHRHFKEVTTLSPLQFHKRLRLYEAQRLMLAESENATGAALAVGYESPTQFNREYKRLFGDSPHRDVSRMR